MSEMPTFNQCELHGKCVDENWNDDKGVSHAVCLTPIPQEALQRLRSARLAAQIHDPERIRRDRERDIANARAVDAACLLVSDWQANGNSRELGDPTADVWHLAARQLLAAVDPTCVTAETWPGPDRTDTALAEIQRALANLDSNLPLSAALDVVTRMRQACRGPLTSAPTEEI